MSRDINMISLLKHNICALKDTSKDDSRVKSNGSVYYLTNSCRQVVNFDAVKTQHLNSLGLSEEVAASVDALFQDAKSDLYFVEFKNGKICNENITRKAKDSVLIFSDIAQLSVGEIRNKSSFWLVVNDETIKQLTPKESIALSRARRGNVDFAIYGLAKLRGYCYKRVNLLSASMLEKELEKMS